MEKIVSNTESVRADKVKLAELKMWKGRYGSMTDLMNRGLDLVIAECKDKDKKLGIK